MTYLNPAGVMHSDTRLLQESYIMTYMTPAGVMQSISMYLNACLLQESSVSMNDFCRSQVCHDV